MTTHKFSDKSITLATQVYVILGLAAGVAGILWAIDGTDSSVTFTAVEGISVFAVLYLIAQTSERIVEFVILALSWKLPSPEVKKEEGLTEVRSASAALFAGAGSSEDKEAAKAEVAKARQALAVFGGGLSLLLCAGMVHFTNFRIVELVGATGVDTRIDAVITTVAATGGSKALHDTISRISKAKEKAEES